MSREHIVELLLRHRWMGTLENCSCSYGLGKPPLTHHEWAEHVATLIEGVKQ